nr:immunoglobulin heavy chain junction region [Mus musculus]
CTRDGGAGTSFAYW